MVSKKLESGKFIEYKGEKYLHDYYPETDKYVLYAEDDTKYKNPLHTIVRNEIDAMINVQSWCVSNYILYEALAVDCDENAEKKNEFCKVKRLRNDQPPKISMNKINAIWTAYNKNGVITNKVYYSKSRKDVDEYVNCKHPYYLEEMSCGNKMISFMGDYNKLKALHNVINVIYGNNIKVIKSSNNNNMEEIRMELAIECVNFNLTMDYWGVITLATTNTEGHGRLVNIMKYLQKNGLNSNEE